MFEIGLLIAICIFLQVLVSRDKKYRRQYIKDIRQYNKNVKAEEKRRIKEEQLKTMRVEHPKVSYLDDYRLKVSTTEPRIG